MHRGKYGNLTPTALARSHQFISPGLLRQQQVRRTYPNISTATPMNHQIDAQTNTVRKPVRNFVGSSKGLPDANDALEEEEALWSNWGADWKKKKHSEYYSPASIHQSESDNSHDEDATDCLREREMNISVTRGGLSERDWRAKRLKCKTAVTCKLIAGKMNHS